MYPISYLCSTISLLYSELDSSAYLCKNNFGITQVLYPNLVLYFYKLNNIYVEKIFHWRSSLFSFAFYIKKIEYVKIHILYFPCLWYIMIIKRKNYGWFSQMGRGGLEPPMFLMSQIYSLLQSPLVPPTRNWSDEIRTHDLLIPNQAPCQTGLHSTTIECPWQDSNLHGVPIRT